MDKVNLDQVEPFITKDGSQNDNAHPCCSRQEQSPRPDFDFEWPNSGKPAVRESESHLW